VNAHRVAARTGRCDVDPAIAVEIRDGDGLRRSGRRDVCALHRHRLGKGRGGGEEKDEGQNEMHGSTKWQWSVPSPAHLT